MLGVLAALAAVAAVRQQLSLPAEERTWHGKVYGVPYDFRAPSLERVTRSWWNPDDASLFPARAFGIGWSINLHRLLQLAAMGLEKWRR
jgi:hypothetical protein